MVDVGLRSIDKANGFLVDNLTLFFLLIFTSLGGVTFQGYLHSQENMHDGVEHAIAGAIEAYSNEGYVHQITNEIRAIERRKARGISGPSDESDRELMFAELEIYCDELTAANVASPRCERYLAIR